MKKILAILALILIVILFIVQSLNNNNRYTSYENGELEYDYERMEEDNKKSRSRKLVLLALFGFHLLIMPSEWLTIGERWKYKEKIEASELSILITRIIGFLLLMSGISGFLIKSMV